MRTTKKKTGANGKVSGLLNEKALLKLKEEISKNRKKGPRAMTIGIGAHTRIKLNKEQQAAVMAALSEVTPSERKNLDLMSTQEIADFLNVSRPFVAKLLDDGKIPGIRVGTHRRAERAAVTAFKDKMQMTQQKALVDLAKEAHRLGITGDE